MSTEKETLGAAETSSKEEELNTEPTYPSASPPSSTIKIQESKAKPVIHYIVIMFAVALSLIILSFLMQQRNHIALMKGITASTINNQTIVDLELETKTLEEKLTESTKQLNTMTEDNKKLQESKASLEQKVQAMEWLMELRLNYSNGKQSKAKDLLKKMQENGLIDALPTESSIPDTSSPRKIYDELLSALS